MVPVHTLLNGLGMNGLGMNGLGMNGLGVNGLGVNGLGVNGLGVNGLGVNGLGGEPPLVRPPWRGGGPGKKRPAPAPKIDPDRLDLDRLVWDPEYRDEIRRRLKPHA